MHDLQDLHDRESHICRVCPVGHVCRVGPFSCHLKLELDRLATTMWMVIFVIVIILIIFAIKIVKII